MALFRKIRLFLIRHSIIRTAFVEDGFIYLDNFRKPTNEITGAIKWLGTQHYHGYYKDKDKALIETFEKDYPQYKGYIWLY